MKLINRLGAFTLLFFAVFLMSCGQDSNTGKDQEVGLEKTEEQETKDEGETAKKPASPRASIEFESEDLSVTIDWGSPAVKGRVIWGDLEPYGTVWRAGANETTSISFTKDMMFGDTKVKAGKYGFFLIPNEDSDWIAILNSDWSRDEHGIWGAMGYSQEKDVARVNITPIWVDKVQERLEYNLNEEDIVFTWEKVRLSIPFQVAE